MSQIVTQNPGSSEIQSPLIAGITEGLNKLSAVLNLKTGTLDDVQLTAVSIGNEEKNKNRIYEANFGNRLWLSSPAPVIKKNGSEITQSGSNFTIDYIGGSITFSAESKPSDGDKITVSATYIIAESDALEKINTALSAVQTQSSKYKGNYDNVGALQLAHSSAQNGDYAIVFDPLAVYAWKNDGWYDTRSIEDLSDYYNKGETNNLLGQKEPTIQQKGTSASDDDYYWGGRKTWQDFKEKVRSTVLTGLSTASDAAVSATDTLLVAVGKLQAQVSKATQRAYLTGTGAPSTSTVGAVGQRYVNTSNGDEYTCEEVSGDTYTWRLHTRSVNGKRPTTPGGDIKLEAADVGAEVAGTGISTYTCTTSGSVHALSGKGNNIKFVADAAYTAGNTIKVNGTTVTAQTQDGTALPTGAWAKGATVVCWRNGTKLTVGGGSGAGSEILTGQWIFALRRLDYGGVGVNTAKQAWVNYDDDLSKTVYAALYAVVGDNLSVGAASGMFNCKKMADRFPLIAGSSYSALSQGGEATHTLTIGEMPSHTHREKYQVPGKYYYSYVTGTEGDRDENSITTNVETEATGGGSAHNNMPPYIGMYVHIHT